MTKDAAALRRARSRQGFASAVGLAWPAASMLI
jgi:hypothetical protein